MIGRGPNVKVPRIAESYFETLGISVDQFLLCFARCFCFWIVSGTEKRRHVKDKPVVSPFNSINV